MKIRWAPSIGYTSRKCTPVIQSVLLGWVATLEGKVAQLEGWVAKLEGWMAKFAKLEGGWLSENDGRLS